jgi:hypothetical protein
MREAGVRTLDQVLPYLYMVLISSGYGIVINSLLTDKPYSIDTPDWIFEMVTKYFAMK